MSLLRPFVLAEAERFNMHNLIENYFILIRPVGMFRSRKYLLALRAVYQRSELKIVSRNFRIYRFRIFIISGKVFLMSIKKTKKIVHGLNICVGRSSGCWLPRGSDSWSRRLNCVFRHQSRQHRRSDRHTLTISPRLVMNSSQSNHRAPWAEYQRNVILHRSSHSLVVVFVGIVYPYRIVHSFVIRKEYNDKLKQEKLFLASLQQQKKKQNFWIPRQGGPCNPFNGTIYRRQMNSRLFEIGWRSTQYPLIRAQCFCIIRTATLVDPKIGEVQ